MLLLLCDRIHLVHPEPSSGPCVVSMAPSERDLRGVAQKKEVEEGGAGGGGRRRRERGVRMYALYVHLYVCTYIVHIRLPTMTFIVVVVVSVGSRSRSCSLSSLQLVLGPRH